MADTILVTGGAGYVGSHVVVELARAGYAPVVLDNFSNSTPAVLPRLQALAGRPVPCVTADVRDVAALRVGLPRPSDFRGRPLRRAQGRRRIAGAAARVLRRQRRRRAGAGRGDGRGRRRHARVQFVRHASTDSRTTCRSPRTRRCGRRTSTGAPSASSRISCATWRKPTPTGASRSCAISIRPARIRRACWARRRAAARTTSCRCCAASPPASFRSCRSTATTGPRPTAPAFATTCTCRTWPRATWRRCSTSRARTARVTFNLGAGRGHSVMEVVAAFESACGRRIGKSFAPRRAGRRGQLLRGSGAREKAAGMARDARPRRHLRRRVALAEERRTVLTRRAATRDRRHDGLQRLDADLLGQPRLQRPRIPASSSPCSAAGAAASPARRP